MTFLFQYPDGPSFIKHIEVSAEGAETGGAVFAFATADGIQAFCKAKNIKAMLEGGKDFKLIVGLDSITNGRAIAQLRYESQKYKGGNLTCAAFMHNESCTFHPKFCWFKKTGNLAVIVGSGNLTMKGLGAHSSGAPTPNWEAFSVRSLTGDAAGKALQGICAWLQAHQGNIVPLDDPRVLAKALTNSQSQPATGISRKSGRVVSIGNDSTEIESEEFDSADILMREISLGRNGQIDVGKKFFWKYFGFERNKDTGVLLQHVSRNNEIGSVKLHALVEKGSKNYCLEIEEAKAKQSKKSGHGWRTIIIFSRLDGRSFRYCVIPTGTSAHARLTAAFFKNVDPKKPGRRMGVKNVWSAELKKAWPNAPTELLPLSVALP